MADTDTTAPAPTGGFSLDQLQQLMQTLAPTPQTQPQSDPNYKPGWVSLLGSALGGGPGEGLTPQEQEHEGIRNLLAWSAGIGAASGWHPYKPAFSEVLAQGTEGALNAASQYETGIMERQKLAQEIATQQQTNRINALKEALPLLQLQARTQQPGLYSGQPGSGAPNTSIANVGSGTYSGAIGSLEGVGKNPNSNAFGTGQFLPSTWQDFVNANPDLFKGMTPEQQMAARGDPAIANKAIDWYAQQNKGALDSAGLPVTGPNLALAHRLGPGAAVKVLGAPDTDPVSKYVSPDALKANPDLQTATVGDLKKKYAAVPAPSFLTAASPATPKPYQVATTGPPPPPPTQPPAAQPSATGVGGGTVSYPGRPETDTPTGGTTQATPGVAAPVPGAPAGLVRLPDGTVHNAGGPGLGGTTQATPGATATPPAQPPAQPQTPAAPAAPPVPDIMAKNDDGLTYKIPDTSISLPQFQQRYRHAPTADELVSRGLVIPGNEPALVGAARAVQQAEQAQAANTAAAQRDADLASRGLQGTESPAKAIQASIDAAAKVQEARQNYNAMLQDTTKTNAAALQNYYKDQDTQLAAAYKDKLTLAQDADQKQKDRDNQIALKKLEGQQALTQAAATSDINAGQKSLEAINATRDGAQDTINSLETAKQLSKLAGTSGFLQQWPQVANMLVRNNLLTPDEVQQLGAQRGLDQVLNKVVLSMRAGSGISRMTNFDLQFLQNTAPSSFTPEQMRPAMFAVIQQAAARQVQYADRVNELHASGMPVWQARQRADEDLGHLVKEVPTTYPKGSAQEGQPMSVDDQNKWIIRNVTPGTFYVQPGGKLAIRGEPKQQAQ